MKRLYLINPCNPLVTLVNSKQNRWNRYTVWKPLGLLSLAALTPEDWEIKVFDENVTEQDYAALPAPTLVGITAFTSQADRAYEIAREFRARNVPVVIGGIHATMCAEEAAQWVDSVVLGEGETVWREVLDDTVAGCLKPTYQGTRASMAGTPAARHDLLPEGYKFGSLQTTRGCPLACGFCSVSAFNGRQYRQRPIDEVVEEFKVIPEKYVLIVDDNFIGTSPAHLTRTKDLLRAIIKAGIRKKWIAQATTNLGEDSELLALASRAGCVGVFVGFETTSDEGLKEINKKFNISRQRDTRKSVRRIHRHGITLLGSFIIGLDVDRKGVGKSIARTAKYYGLDIINVVFLTPLPGTRLWEEMSVDNRVILNRSLSDWRYFTLTYPVARYKHLSWRDMLNEKDECLRTFYGTRAIARRVLSCVTERRNPFVTLFSNLSYRVNALRLDRKAYREFDASPGEVTMVGEATVAG